MFSLKRAPHDARLWLVALVLCLSLCPLLVGCGAQPLSGSFAGHVSNSQAFIALVTSDHKVIAYACDSQTLAQWFSGSLSDSNTLDLTNQSGARLQARLSATQATGTLTLPDGQAFSFTAPAVTGDAGLYRARQDLQDQPYVGGWVQLPGGEERGLVTQGNTPVSAWSITPGHLTVNVTHVGQLAAHQITPELVSMNVGLQSLEMPSSLVRRGEARSPSALCLSTKHARREEVCDSLDGVSPARLHSLYWA